MTQVSGHRGIVRLDAIQRAYVKGLIDFAEFERRVAAFLTMERDSVSYWEAYALEEAEA